MRSTIAFFFIALITMTMAYDADIQFLKSLKRKSSYGKNLLDTIQIQLMSTSEGNGIDVVITQLELMLKQTVIEESQDVIDNGKTQAQVKSVVREQSIRIKKIQTEIETDSLTISTSKIVITEQEKIKIQQNKILSSLKHKLEVNLEQQKKAKAAYLKAYDALSTQNAGLAEARAVLLQLRKEPSDKEIDLAASNTQHIAPQAPPAIMSPPSPHQYRLSFSSSKKLFLEMTSHIKNLKFQHPKYQGMINVLAELMSPEIVADQKLVDNIIEIIDRLAEQLRLEMKIITMTYEERSGNLKASETVIRTNIDSAQSELDSALTKIGQEQETIVNTQQKIIQITQELNQTTQERSDSIQQGINRQRKFVSESHRRTEEIEIIKKCLVIFRTRFSDAVKAVVRNL